MISRDQQLSALAIHMRKGGFVGRPGAHACKVLGEMVELCLAAGASPHEVAATVQAEISKHNSTRDSGPTPFNLEETKDEIADVLICLAFLVGHMRLDVGPNIDKKIALFEGRDTEPDSDGVVRRKGRTLT